MENKKTKAKPKSKPKAISPIWFQGSRLVLVGPETYKELNMSSYGGIQDVTVLDVVELVSELIKNKYVQK